MEIELTHLSGSRTNAVDTFHTLPISIGRSNECQIRFDPDKDRKVSAQHCELRKSDDGGLVICDLESRNGVLVNGVKVQKSAPVPNNAILEIGAQGPRMRLTFREGGGISFSKLRRQNTSQQPPKSDALAATDDSFPVVSEEDLFEEKQKASITENKELMLILFGVGVLMGLIVIAIVIFL